jgi:hypothetical protein
MGASEWNDIGTSSHYNPGFHLLRYLGTVRFLFALLSWLIYTPLLEYYRSINICEFPIDLLAVSLSLAVLCAL